MRHPLTWVRQTQTSSGGGYTWEAVDSNVYWFEIVPLGGRETEVARGVEATATHRLRSFAISGLLATDGFQNEAATKVYKLIAPPRDFEEIGAEMELQTVVEFEAA